jgi:hypothetical protein
VRLPNLAPRDPSAPLTHPAQLGASERDRTFTSIQPTLTLCAGIRRNFCPFFAHEHKRLVATILLD